MLDFKKSLELLSLAADPKGRRALLKWKPFSITSYYMLRRLKNLGMPFGTIIDCGANVGQFARAAAETFPESKILSFEPLPEVAARLKKNFEKCERFKLFNAALGSRNGKITFHRNTHSHSSSALPLHKNHKESFPDAKLAGDLLVPLLTLDTALKGEDLVKPVLLKLDLQGYELEALKGATNTLKRVTGVLLEAAFEPMYQGEASFSELEEFLRVRGFRFERALDFLKDAQSNIVQMDALFLKKQTGQK